MYPFSSNKPIQAKTDVSAKKEIFQRGNKCCFIEQLICMCLLVMPAIVLPRTPFHGRKMSINYVLLNKEADVSALGAHLDPLWCNWFGV
jgi:hypothetical protein